MTSQKKSRTIQQHFVTAAYLAGFTKDGMRSTRLVSYERNTDRIFEVTPDKTAKRRNYYSIPLRDGSFDDTADKIITSLENQALPVLRRIIHGDYNLTKFERALVAYLVAFQELRTPWVRSMFETMAETQTRAVMTVAAKAPGVFERHIAELRAKGEDSGVTAEGLRRAILEERIVPKAQPHASIATLMDVAPRIGDIYVQMQWVVLRPKDGLLFLTSDTPVVRSDPGPRFGMYGSGGLMSSTVEVWFPLARNACLLIRPDKIRADHFFRLLEQGKREDALRVQSELPLILEAATEDQTVDKINRQTITNAERFVYSPVRYDWIPAFFRGESQNMRLHVSGLGAPKHEK